MNHRLILAASALALLCIQSCKKAEPTPKPELRDITVSLSSKAEYDYLKSGKVSYTVDGKTATANLKDGKFTASVGPDAKTIEVSIGAQTFNAKQAKYYLNSERELKENMIAKGSGEIGDNDAAVVLEPQTAALKIKLLDSKAYALGERILSVSFAADKMEPVSVEWKSGEPDEFPLVAKAAQAAEFGMAVKAGGSLSGKFTVVTNRHTYVFTKSAINGTAGKVSTVSLDFCAPDEQPVRKVGVLGDSISTFAGYMDPSYSAFYPGNDATAKGGTGTVQEVNKTYWWKVINEKMKYGELDNGWTNSWSGTKVITEGGVKGFVDRAYAFDNPDIIMIHGGTNDMNQTSSMGNFDYDLPMGQLNANCFRSAYIKLIKMLQNRYPGVQIIIIVGDRLSYYEYNNSKPELNYATSVIQIAQHFGLPYVDFTNGGKSYNSLPKSTGSHPNATGMQQMADKIYENCVDYLP